MESLQKMNRYFHSFLLSLFLYSSLVGAIFYVQKEHFVTMHKKKPQVVALKLCAPEIPQKTASKIVPKPKPLPEKPKPLPKKPDPKPVEKKIVKKIKKPLPKNPPKEKIVRPEPLKEVPPKPIESEMVASKAVDEVIKPVQVEQKTQLAKQTTSPVATFDLEKERENYFEQVHELIDKNKIYPKLAQKRNIEDRVVVSFVISKDGDLVSYEIIEGKTLFRSSIIDALQKSFPLKPKDGVLTSDTTVNIEVLYTLI